MAAPALPSGTVTFLFTDIEGSTMLLEELGSERYGELLSQHHRVCRVAWVAHQGVEVDTAGDAFFVAFPTASGALSAAGEAQVALGHLGLRVRIGVHTGEASVNETGYVGLEVHRAARIAAAGHGGQVLVSSSTAALVGADVLRDLGEHRFKDLAAPERVFQMGESEFPPLKSLYRTNLPVPATSFLGRERELGEVLTMLGRGEVRLVTLTGPGGTGKTRLALQAAAEASDGFADGVFWVPLAPLRDPSLAFSSVAEALGVKEVPGRHLVDVLAERLAGKRMLALLDNAEHLLPELAETVTRLVAVGGLTVLVTSRERLQVSGEHVYPVPELDTAEGVELFLTRAAAAGVPLEATPLVHELCGRLEHLPLALELAASRTPLFSPEQLLERLTQRLDLLKGGRDTDPRQRTLRATIEWSYDLLSEHEQRLLRGLSVFAGGCTYEAAEGVCDAEPDTLQSLLDKSLVRRRDTDLGQRYWMLETIREYAADALAAGEQPAELAEKHARWYARTGVALSVGVRKYDPQSVATFTDELANLRAGLAWAIEHRDARLAGDFLFAAWFAWLTSGHRFEAVKAARDWLALDWRELDPLDRFPGIVAAAEILRFSHDLDTAEELKLEGIDIARQNLDRCVYGWKLSEMLPGTLTDLSDIRLDQGRLDDAESLAVEALALRRELGRPGGISHALSALAGVAYARGEFAAARGILLEVLQGWEEAEADVDAAMTRVWLAGCELLLGATEAARERLARTLPEIVPGVDLNLTWSVVQVCAMLATAADDYERAALLAGAVEAYLDERGVELRSRYEIEVESGFLDRGRAALGDEVHGRLLVEGRLLDEEAALTLAATTVAGGAS